MSDDGTQVASASSWAVPGVAPVPSGVPTVVEVQADVQRLREAVDAVLAVAPAALAPGAAVARAEDLLVLQERVSAAALRAVGDVEARELWRLRAAGSTRTWLRTLPCGDRGQVAVRRLLESRPVVDAALSAGELSVRTASVVARELARVPGHVPDDQLQGVLVDGVGDLLGVWAGAACLDPTPGQEAEFDRRRTQLADAVRTGLADCWSDAAGQLEPAFVLAAQVLAPAELDAGLRLLVDALQPEAEAEAVADREHRSRGLVLRRLSSGGWSLRAHLTDEVGQLLFDALAVREDTHPGQRARQTRQDREDAPGATVEDLFGTDGSGQPESRSEKPGSPSGRPGRPSGEAEPESEAAPESEAPSEPRATPGPEAAPELEEPLLAGTPDAALHDAAADDDDDHDTDGDTDTDGDLPADMDTDGDGDEAGRFGDVGPGEPLPPFGSGFASVEQGTPVAAKDQRAHDALARLLADLHGVPPGSGVPAPAHLTLVASVRALDGLPGAPPGRLRTAQGDVVLTAARLRRAACGSVLSAVLVDARGRPVGASGDHRHATRRERRAMRAAWGSACGVNGCTLPGEVPHHAEPFWKARATAVKDLVPLCTHHHHDVHDGHRTLRLRDGRLLDEWGWVRDR